MGSELAVQMDQDGHDVTVVDIEPQAFYRLGSAFKGRTIEGVGFDRGVLMRAGVERADALAAVTSGDNRNIIVARVARNIFHVPKVIARLYDPRRAEIYQRLGLQSVSSTAWGVSRAIQLLSHAELYVTTSLGNGEVEIVELEAPVHWSGRTFIPTTGTVFQDGDRIAISLLTTARGRLEDLMALR
jgi:trk system potassium uptake protein TrkA